LRRHAAHLLKSLSTLALVSLACWLLAGCGPLEKQLSSESPTETPAVRPTLEIVVRDPEWARSSQDDPFVLPGDTLILDVKDGTGLSAISWQIDGNRHAAVPHHVAPAREPCVVSTTVDTDSLPLGGRIHVAAEATTPYETIPIMASIDLQVREPISVPLQLVCDDCLHKDWPIQCLVKCSEFPYSGAAPKPFGDAYTLGVTTGVATSLANPFLQGSAVFEIFLVGPESRLPGSSKPERRLSWGRTAPIEIDLSEAGLDPDAARLEIAVNCAGRTLPDDTVLLLHGKEQYLTKPVAGKRLEGTNKWALTDLRLFATYGSELCLPGVDGIPLGATLIDAMVSSQEYTLETFPVTVLLEHPCPEPRSFGGELALWGDSSQRVEATSTGKHMLFGNVPPGIHQLTLSPIYGSEEMGLKLSVDPKGKPHPESADLKAFECAPEGEVVLTLTSKEDTRWYPHVVRFQPAFESDPRKAITVSLGADGAYSKALPYGKYAVYLDLAKGCTCNGRSQTVPIEWKPAVETIRLAATRSFLQGVDCSGTSSVDLRVPIDIECRFLEHLHFTASRPDAVQNAVPFLLGVAPGGNAVRASLPPGWWTLLVSSRDQSYLSGQPYTITLSTSDPLEDPLTLEKMGFEPKLRDLVLQPGDALMGRNCTAVLLDPISLAPLGDEFPFTSAVIRQTACSTVRVLVKIPVPGPWGPLELCSKPIQTDDPSPALISLESFRWRDEDPLRLDSIEAPSLVAPSALRWSKNAAVRRGDVSLSDPAFQWRVEHDIPQEAAFLLTLMEAEQDENWRPTEMTALLFQYPAGTRIAGREYIEQPGSLEGVVVDNPHHHVFQWRADILLPATANSNYKFVASKQGEARLAITSWAR